MCVIFLGYLILYSLRADKPAETGGVFDSSDMVFTEHINEEDDYQKPVCKRLEETGERYSQDAADYYGEI